MIQSKIFFTGLYLHVPVRSYAQEESQIAFYFLRYKQPYFKISYWPFSDLFLTNIYALTDNLNLVQNPDKVTGHKNGSMLGASQ
jgi:hypothetical protein